MRIYIFIISLLCCFNSAQADIKFFTYDSLDVIENHHQESSFLLVLWSIDCPPCIQEFSIFQQLKKEFPLFNLVLINTDGLSEKALAEKTLMEFSLDESENWIFSESNIEKLRYRIDNRWAGELPRSYFYQKDLPRSVVSGLLSKNTLKTWLQQQACCKYK